MKRFLTFMIFSWHAFLFVAESDVSLVQFQKFVKELPKENFEKEMIIKLFRMPLQEIQQIHVLWEELFDYEGSFDPSELFICNFMARIIQVQVEFKEKRIVKRVPLSIAKEMDNATARSTELFDQKGKKAAALLANARLELLQKLENNL